MADDARELVAEAEREAQAGATGAALRALDRAYVPVQTPRDLATVRRAVALARRIQSGSTLTGRERRKVRNIVEAYEELERSYSSPAARAAAALPPRGPRPLPSLGWVDGLVAVLGCFTALVLVGGLVVLVEANTATARVATVAGAVFWATILGALIAIIRLLQAIERNTRSSEPDDGVRPRPA
jgi:hypothetical protein